MMQPYIHLKGYSGCEIKLIKSPSLTFVRKISKDQNYNSRLEKQIKKQILFSHPQIKTPKVLNTGRINNLFYADMEYISGINLSKYIEDNIPENTLNIISNVLTINSNHNYQYDKKTLKTKIFEIASNLKNLSISHKIYLLDILNADIDCLGYCHGDLNLNNIIISNNQIYLIDFLDSFIDSPLIDISKLLMDLIYGWSWKDTYSAPLVKNKIIFNKLTHEYTEEKFFTIKKLICLHLFRILPYATNHKDQQYIINSIDHCISHLKL